MAPWWRRILNREDSGDAGLPRLPSRTCACDRGAHHDCGHVLGIVGAAEGEVTLCSCACHEPCPIGRQRSAGELDFMLTCTCPAHLTIRRNQERAGLDPAEIVRLTQARRQQRTPLSDDQRQEVVKQGLIRAYQAAAGQAVGLPPAPGVFFDRPPQEVAEHIVLRMALTYSDAEAARLLGLTDAQVAAAKKAGHARMKADARRQRVQRETPRWRSRR